MIAGSSEAAPFKTKKIDSDHHSKRDKLPFTIRIDRNRRHDGYYYQNRQLYRPNYENRYYNENIEHVTSSYIVDTDRTNAGFVIKLANGMFFHIISNHDFEDGTTVDVFMKREGFTNRYGEYYINIYGFMYNAERVK